MKQMLSRRDTSSVMSDPRLHLTFFAVITQKDPAVKFELDKFNGVIIDPLSIPDCADEFHKHLSGITHFAVTENKNLIWLTLPINKSHLIKPATDLRARAHFVH